MSLYAIADRRFTVKRKTAFVLDAVTAAATLTATRNPVTPALIEVRVTGGTNNTGTVTVNGLTESGGLPAEASVLTFTGAGYQTTSVRFSTLTTFTTTGLADETTKPTVSARAVGPGGQPQLASYTVVADRCAALGKTRGQWPVGIAGTAETVDELSTFLVPYEDVWAPREGDVLVDDHTAEEFHVLGVVEARGRLRVRHWELRVQRRQGTA